MPTVHINAKDHAFAETVLLPGDPLRAKHVAENFLENAIEVTNVRNILGYTGTFKGHKISVMATGMGIPSANIYATELVTSYGVKNLIRIGTAGIYPNFKSDLGDIIIASGACTDSSANRLKFNNFDLAAIASFSLIHQAYLTAQENNIATKVGNCFSSDHFYCPVPEMAQVLTKMGILCIEMEAAGLYAVALEHNVNALAILTVSDVIGDKSRELSSTQRQTGLNTMITLALDTAIKL